VKVIVSAYLIVVAVASLWTFGAYGIDKRRAQTGNRRIPEKTLQLLALAGGWPGALLGQQVFRHKTQKLSFQIVFWTVVVLHVGLVGGVAYWMPWR
jgi:uncharacterized membrane protein YsdA (DUF1294 family)